MSPVPGTSHATLLPDGAYAHLVDQNGLVLLASGAGAPTATADTYARGAAYLKNDGSSGQAIYTNEGTSAAPSWVLAGAVAASEVTLARGSVLAGNASGVGAALDAKGANKFLMGDGTDVASVTAAAAVAALVAIVGVAAGYKVARGQHTTVDEDDTVVTGLTTVVSAVASLESDPVAGATSVTCVIGNQSGAPAAGSIQIKSWKPTAAGDTAPTAATTFTKKVNWIAIGT